MKVGIPKEIYPHESRVAAVPETVHKIRKLGFDVVVEAGAGDAADLRRQRLRRGGRRPSPPNAAALCAEADVVLKVRQPMARRGGGHEADLMKEGAALIGFFWPAQNKELDRAAGGAQGDRAGDGRRPAHHARAADGRAVGDGEHRRLPRRHRGGQPLRALLPRADHGGGPGQAGAGAGHRRRRRRAGGDRGGASAGRRGARLRHARRGARAGGEPGRARSSSSSSRRRAKGRAATPRR